MAIWDNTNESVHWSSGSVEVEKCPRCGKNVYFDDKLGMNICRICGGVFDKETREMAYSFDIRDAEPAGYEESKLREFTCRSCGATVLSDKRSTLEFCAFCGSKDIMQSEPTKQFRPDQYIPFTVTKDYAISKLKEFAKGKAFVPASYNTNATMSKVTGLYVPFWLIDSDNHLKIKAAGTKKFGEDSGKRYDLDIEYDYRVTGVPFDGAKGVNDRLMEAIEPYDYKALRPFDPECLNGYYAERFDESPLDMSERIISRMYLYSDQCTKYACSEYNDLRIKQNDSTINSMKQRYVLLPMWFLNYEYEGTRYRFAVNGQTGEVDGDMPVSTSRSTLQKLPLRILFALPAVALIAAIIIGLVFFHDMFFNSLEYVLKYGFFIVMFLIGTFYFGFGRNAGSVQTYINRLERRKDIVRGVVERIDDIPEAADRMLAHSETELKRTMDEVPEVMAYYEAVPGAEPKIKTSEVTATVITRSKANDR